MKIRYSTFVLCMLTAHCFSMDNYNKEATLSLQQEFEKHIVTQTLPDFGNIRSFLNNNANPNIRVTASTTSVYGKKTVTYTPLIFACLHDNTAYTCLLLQHGADPNLYIPHAVHYSPLAAACTSKNFPVVKLLLDHNADVNYAPFHKLTPLELICKNSELNNTSVIIANLLLRNGANVNTTRINPHLPGDNALYYADACGNKKLIALLLNYGAIINPKRSPEKISEDTQAFMSLRSSVQENLPLAFFYDTRQETEGLCAHVPKEIALIICNYYHRLKTAAINQTWKNMCCSVYDNSTERAIVLQLSPFMTIKERLEICTSYYLRQKKYLVFAERKL